eukprot:GGOE01023237.1.p1 GENE.GGOE01023237.1~~GGOE01023237.1.p1  ORF type:complete len:355 (-),score=92.80 GGOE01023237.1:475-1443(-)
MAQLHYFALGNPHAYTAMVLGVIVLVAFLPKEALFTLFTGPEPQLSPWQLSQLNMTAVKYATSEEEPEDRQTSIRRQADLWKDASRPKGQSPRRDIPPSVQCITEEYYKEFSNTKEHLATSFASSLFIEQEFRLTSLRQLLPALAHFFEATRVTYWLDWGTLLGAWRNGSIIPWDDDGDVGILGGEPLRRVARHAHGFHFRCHECLFIIRYNFTADDIPFLFIDRQTGVYIDIFQYLDTGTVLTNEALPTYSLNTQPRDRVLPTTPCTLERRTYHCPRQPKEYLLKIYNGDLAIPWRYRFDVDPTESVQESDGSSARGVADM